MNKYACQVYQSEEKNWLGYYECYCSECGELVVSMCRPSERKQCPHCGYPFHPKYTMSYEKWRESHGGKKDI